MDSVEFDRGIISHILLKSVSGTLGSGLEQGPPSIPGRSTAVRAVEVMYSLRCKNGRKIVTALQCAVDKAVVASSEKKSPGTNDYFSRKHIKVW